MKRIRRSANARNRNALNRLARASRESVAASLPRREEGRLLVAARAGDPRALRQLLTALAGPAYRFGRGFCGDPDDAEDVMQEVLVALARDIGRVRGDGSLTSWAYVVARRVCLRHRRRRSGEPARMASLEAGPEGDGEAGRLAAPGADPLDRVERRELGAILERAILALPATQREVLLLRDVEGLSARAVARALGVGERAVKSRLHRARMALRQALAPRLAPSRSPVAATGATPRPATGGAAPGCPDTARLVSRYLEGELTPARCDELAAHVDACAACRSACDVLRQALGACRAWGRSPLPAPLRARVREAIRDAAGSPPPVARERARA